uniref:C2H2-type domain-containing protein n=1 Tax=Syphacia muris TaxID=451379 RepID=A0A0N5A8N6_9BILA
MRASVAVLYSQEYLPIAALIKWQKLYEMATPLSSTAASLATSAPSVLSVTTTSPLTAATVMRPSSLSTSLQLAIASSDANNHQLSNSPFLIFPVTESMTITTDYKKSLKSIVDDEIVLPLPKSDSQMGGVSPVSVDSGFESSFPSSPESSLGENRNLLLQKTDDHSVGENVYNCKLNIQKDRRSLISPAAFTSKMAASPDTGSDLPDVIMLSSNQHSNASVRDECNDSLQKLDIDISTLSAAKSLNSTPNTQSVNEQEKLTANQTSSSSNSVYSSGTKTESEFCEYPSTSVASSSSCTPSVAQSVSDDTEDAEFFCRWDNCGQQFCSELELFDHVMKGHFECLHPLEDANSLKRLKAGAKCRTKNLICKWDNCDMGLSRGDLTKQFLWLKEHFFTRHFRKAKPYCCLFEGCSARFSFKRALEDHLRTGHDKMKRTDSGRRKKTKVESCLEWTPLPYYPPSEKNDFLDKATIEFMVMQLRKCEMMQHPQFVSRPPPGPRGGAAYRKRKRILTWDIVPLEDYYKQEIERKRNEIANGVPQVGEYASNEWKKIFSKIL